MRRGVTVVAFAAVAALSLSLSIGIDAAPLQADLSSAVAEVQTCHARPELGLGSTGDDVRCLQYLLILLGLPVGYTGTYDAATRDAIRWYQATHPPLNADGVAGEQTLLSLGIRSTLSETAGAVNEVALPNAGATCLADAEQIVGSVGQSVVCMQKRLAELGLYGGKATGTFDAALQSAVRAFQQSRPPLQVDGRAGPRTLAAMGIWSGVSPDTGVATGSTIGEAPVATSLELEPQWNMTADGIPFFGNHQACTRPDAITIATEFARDGADIATQYWAVYIASREGGCRANAVNINPSTRDDSHCSFQINVLSGTFEPHGELGRRGWTPDLIKASMQNCADAASDLWVFCGRGPWTPPYSCRPPWEGAADLPKDPVTTTTLEPPVDDPPVTDPPVTDAPVVTDPATTSTSAPPTSTTPPETTTVSATSSTVASTESSQPVNP